MVEATKRFERFPVSHRLWHLALIFIFMLMSVTGIAWMYIETPWGKGLADFFGGYKQTLEIHRIGGLVLLAGFVLHILWMLTRIDWNNLGKSLYGPDSLMMRLSDIKALFQHFGWIIGVCKHPRFERWSWWEKFDYWAVWWGFMIVGVTGLMLYNPVLTADFMPGWLINIALWVHRIESVMAMAHVFSIHFFIEHFRPTTFPFNGAMFDGTIDIDEARKDHPEWIARLESEGKLEDHMTNEPPVLLRIAYFGFGYCVIFLGFFLLAFGLINVTALTLF